uniref:Uncharacterized protein n=1 Tax=Anguilla anguilla TaxID=7936 RepID=A0A0E9XRM9_ANGAN
MCCKTPVAIDLTFSVVPQNYLKCQKQ